MDFAIITMRIPSLAWQLDMELPVKVRIDELCGKILNTLKKYDPDTFQSISGISLQWNEKILNKGMSLSDYQIWDGNMLEIVY